MTVRLAVLAFDGLDWGLIQTLVDAGRMPCVAQLIERGSSGPLTVSPPGGDAPTWTTMATGVLADRHGVCHDFAARQDGLGVVPMGVERLRTPTLWSLAASAGMVPCVAAWPALLHSGDSLALGGAFGLPVGRWVRAGFDSSVNATPEVWPLSPGIAWPDAARDDLRDTLIHWSEAPEPAIAALLAEVPAAVRQALHAGTGELVARWSSLQALGLSWAGKAEADVLALRFTGLAVWGELLRHHVGTSLPDALVPCYQWIDLLIGRHMNLLGPTTHIAVISDRGLPNGGYRAEADLQGAPGPGFLIVSGASVPADGLLVDARDVDVCPTLLACLGLLDDELARSMDGRNLLGQRTFASVVCPPGCQPAEAPASPPIAHDEEAATWLSEQGLPKIDTAHLRALAAAVQLEACLAWTTVRRHRGALDDAIVNLYSLLGTAPADLRIRLTLGDALLAANRFGECETLLREAPAAAREGLWLDTYAGLIAFAARDWSTAETHLRRLADHGRAPFNAPVFLGWARLHQGDWTGARQWLESACRWPGDAVRAWEGLGIARFNLRRFREAAVAFSRAIAASPATARLHARRAQAWSAAGDVEQAQSGWWRALELDPSMPGAFASLARESLMAVQADRSDGFTAR